MMHSFLQVNQVSAHAAWEETGFVFMLIQQTEHLRTRNADTHEGPVYIWAKIAQLLYSIVKCTTNLAIVACTCYRDELFGLYFPKLKIK